MASNIERVFDIVLVCISRSMNQFDIYIYIFSVRTISSFCELSSHILFSFFYVVVGFPSSSIFSYFHVGVITPLYVVWLINISSYFVIYCLTLLTGI